MNVPQQSEPEFLTFKELRNQFQGIDSASLCSLGEPVRQIELSYRAARLEESIPELLKRFTNSGSELCDPDFLPFSATQLTVKDMHDYVVSVKFCT
jgi:hypothetical protein